MHQRQPVTSSFDASNSRSQKKVGNFSESSDILVNIDLLHLFLLSEKSPFEVCTVQDFIETLDILGFSRRVIPDHGGKKQVMFRYSNPNFKRGQPVPDDLYKLKTSPQYTGKSSKRMLNTHNIKFIQNLLEKHHSPPLKITKLDLAHMKLQFALETQLEKFVGNAEAVESPVDDPDYVKTKEIAGYYGDVPLDALKFAFQNYFPIYNPDSEEVPQVPAAPMNPVWQTTAPVMWQVPAQASSSDQIVPEKKYSKLCREANRENEQALAFLHQESLALQMAEDGPNPWL